MTVAATLTQRQYTGTGTSAQFSFPNKIFSAGDLVVTIYDTSGNVYPFVNFANAALGWTYSVQNVDVDTGCIVVLSNVLTSGWVLDIRSLIPELQSTSVKNQGQFLPELHEEAFDRATRMIQDLLRLTYTYGIHGPDTEFTAWPALPGPTTRRGYGLLFDAATGLPTLGFLSAQNVTQGLIGPILNPQTAAESGAGVTPVNFVYPELTFERYGGGVAATSAANNTAMLNAIAVVLAKVGGGTLLIQGAGTYNFGANTYNIPTGMNIQGGGYQTTLLYTGSGVFLGMPNSGTGGGRNLFQNFQLFGPGNGAGVGNAGTGIQLGDASGPTGIIVMRQVLIIRFATALRVGGCIWGLFQMCEFGNPSGGLGSITNNVGIDFNAAAAGNQTNVMTFENCIVSNNAIAGVAATNVPITMNCLQWINTNVQNNCQSATTNPQFYCGATTVMTIDNMYMEYVLGGTPPDAIRSDGWGKVDVRGLFINTAANGIKDRAGGAMANVRIHEAQIFGITTAAINCVAEDDVVIYNSTISSGTITLTGVGCRYLPDGSGLASWPNDENGFTPALAFGGGSITQTLPAAYWSQIGHVVTFSLRINWSAIAAPTGNVTITGLPKAPVAAGPDVVCAVWSSGVTIASGSIVLEIPNGSTTGTLYNVQTTTAAVQGGALAASGAVIISGSYQV